MALTIGLRKYGSSADLRVLCADEHFLQVLRTELARIVNEGERQRAESRAKAKLKKWVTNDAKYLIPFGAKGQGKMFPSYQAAVKWLLYKTRKTFADNQRQETELAESIHGNARIRKLLFDFLRGPLATWWGGLEADMKQQIGAKTGRYAHFYSKLFCNRTIREGFDYFGIGGAGFFSKTVTEANLSISEAAAFISDVALQSKKECGIKGKHMPGIDNLRYNLTEVDQKTRQALDAAFVKLSSDTNKGMFAEDRHKDLMRSLKKFLPESRRLEGHPQFATAVGMVFEDVKRAIRENAEGDSYLATVEKGNIMLSSDGNRLSQKASSCETVAEQIDFLRKNEGAIEIYLTKSRQGARQVAELQATLRPALDADRNKTPESLRAVNGKLYEKVRAAGEDRSKRMEYNVDPDHEWTKFMINHDAVVGAGPSGTTTFTLGLVELACAGGSATTKQMAAYAVAMALFSFWQRKKKLLKYQSTVHTWNEVCAALDHHRGANAAQRSRDRFLQVSDTGKLDDNAGCDLYAYPKSFNNVDGRPEYDAGGISFADLLGE